MCVQGGRLKDPDWRILYMLFELIAMMVMQHFSFPSQRLN